jgi:hypothetical protein
MNYKFLQKAQTQPDLADFCEYVKKPLMVLEDILTRYEDLQLNKKVNHENLELYHKCDNILNKHLPIMVDNFCNFSFEYRNSEKIRVDENTSLTAKELLLKNLAKVIEEVKVIEKDFNRNNSFTAVVHNKVLEQYGFQPELSPETGKVVKNNIELDNQFNYEKFVETTQFKKAPISINKNDEESQDTPNADILDNTSSGGGIGLLEVVLVLTVAIILSFGTMAYYGKARNELANKVQQTTVQSPVVSHQPLLSNIEKIQSAIKLNYSNGNYKNIDETTLTDKVDFKEFTTMWETLIQVKPYKLEKNNDSYALEFDLPADKDGSACKEISTVIDRFDVVKFGGIYVMKKDNTVTKKMFDDYCTLDKFSTIPKNRVTLISK